MLSGTQTRLLYIFVFLISSLFAFFSQYATKTVVRKGKTVEKINLFAFFMALIIPWGVLSFTNIGSDYSSYSFIIERLTWENFNTFYDEEPMINVLFLLLKTITSNNTGQVIFIVKTLTIGLFFFSIYMTREKIKIVYSVLAYLLLMYLPSFYLLSIALSAAIVCNAFSIYFISQKKLLPFLLVFLAAQLHNSAYLMIPVFVLIMFWKKLIGSQMKRVGIIIAYSVVCIFSAPIYVFIQQNISGFHYNSYFGNSFQGSGLMIFVKYIPLFIIWYLLYKNKNVEKNVSSWIFIFALTSCLFSIMAYSFVVIERMEFYILPLYTILFSSMFRKNNINNYKGMDALKTVSIEKLLVVAYLLFIGILSFINRTSVSSGVGNYVFFNPFM